MELKSEQKSMHSPELMVLARRKRVSLFLQRQSAFKNHHLLGVHFFLFKKASALQISARGELASQLPPAGRRIYNGN